MSPTRTNERTNEGSGVVRAAGLVVVLALVATGIAHASQASRDRLAWLPASVLSVEGGPPADVPLLAFLSNTMGAATPPCWSAQLASFEEAFQVKRAADEYVAVLVRGRLDRAAMEHCMDEVLKALVDRLLPQGALPHISRQGTMTEIMIARDSRTYIGWGEGWAAWHEDRAWVQELVSATRRSSGADPRLSALIDEVVEGDRPWSVFLLDYTSAFIGVPSRGIILNYPARKGSSVARGRCFFDSPKQARRAAQALKNVAKSQSLAPEIRAFIASLRPRPVADSLELTIDVMLMADPAFAKAAQAELDRVRAAAAPPRSH